MKGTVFLVIALSVYPASVYPNWTTLDDVMNVTTSQAPLELSERIYSGDEAKDNEFPFMIFMFKFKNPQGSARCSASLLHPFWVITAAHCVESEDIRPQDIYFAGGRADVKEYMFQRVKLPRGQNVDEAALDLQERQAAVIYRHPDYNPDTKSFDISVIKLEKPFDPPNVTFVSISLEKMKKPMRCTILGWGKTGDSEKNFKLRYVHNVSVKTKDMGCQTQQKGYYICLLQNPTERSCVGDSGSPLVCDGKVWGVASYDFKGQVCSATLEDLYSEIYPAIEWINNPYNAESSTAVTSKCTFLWISFCFLFKTLRHLLNGNI